MLSLRNKLMRQTRWHLYPFVIFLCSWQLISAQDCSKNLRDAQRCYEQGQPEKAIVLLDSCKHKFGRSEKAQALELLTTLYLLEENPKADEVFELLLKFDPEYDVRRSQELVYLYNDFRTQPIFYLEFNAGASFSFVKTGQSFGVDNERFRNKQYDKVLTYQGGINISTSIFHRNVRIGTGINYQGTSYTLTQSAKTFSDDLIDPNSFYAQSDIFELNFEEAQFQFSIPVFLSLNFDSWEQNNYNKRKLVPYFYVGSSLLIEESIEMQSISRNNRVGSLEKGLANNDIKKLRNNINYELFVGAGIKLKVKRNYFTVNVRFSSWLRNVVDLENRYANQELTYRYGHVDDDFSFNKLGFYVGYEKNIYSPKRKL